MSPFKVLGITISNTGFSFAELIFYFEVDSVAEILVQKILMTF